MKLIPHLTPYNYRTILEDGIEITLICFYDDIPHVINKIYELKYQMHTLLTTPEYYAANVYRISFTMINDKALSDELLDWHTKHVLHP